MPIHEGRTLRELAGNYRGENGKGIAAFARELGISRTRLYEFFDKKELSPSFKEKVSEVLEEPVQSLFTPVSSVDWRGKYYELLQQTVEDRQFLIQLLTDLRDVTAALQRLEENFRAADNRSEARLAWLSEKLEPLTGRRAENLLEEVRKFEALFSVPQIRSKLPGRDKSGTLKK